MHILNLCLCYVCWYPIGQSKSYGQTKILRDREVSSVYCEQSHDQTKHQCDGEVRVGEVHILEQ